MHCQYRVTFEDGSTITVVSGNPISAAEAAKRAKTVSVKRVAQTVPINERKK